MAERFLCFCLDRSCGPDGKAVGHSTLYRHLAADREAARILQTSGYEVDQELLDAIKRTEKRLRKGSESRHHKGANHLDQTNTDNHAGQSKWAHPHTLKDRLKAAHNSVAGDHHFLGDLPQSLEGQDDPMSDIEPGNQSLLSTDHPPPAGRNLTSEDGVDPLQIAADEDSITSDATDQVDDDDETDIDTFDVDTDVLVARALEEVRGRVDGSTAFPQAESPYARIPFPTAPGDRP